MTEAGLSPLCFLPMLGLCVRDCGRSVEFGVGESGFEPHLHHLLAGHLSATTVPNFSPGWSKVPNRRWERCVRGQCR